MPIEAPITPSNFYDSLPTPDHRTGDIWRDLPTFGNLGRDTTHGIVITPACDLAQRKCETITYLPIVSADEYLGSSAFRHECWTEIRPLLERLPGYADTVAPSRYGLIAENDLTQLLSSESGVQGKSIRNVDAEKIRAYLQYVKASARGAATANHLRQFIKSDKLALYVGRLITNALKPDIHFLPGDGKPSAYSAIPGHSVVLFRYPLTIPISLLDAAQNLSKTDWLDYVKANNDSCKLVKYMPNWPIKLALLRGEFLSDMLARYISMYVRLGSSDFSEQAVTNMAREIGV